MNVLPRVAAALVLETKVFFSFDDRQQNKLSRKTASNKEF
jgi:hypothetical protein